MAQEHSPLDHVIDHPTLEIPLVGDLAAAGRAGLQITRFMVMEVIAAVLLIAGLRPAGPARRRKRVTRGRS